MDITFETSRIDCRIFNDKDKLVYFFIMNRIDASTVMVSGITFKITRHIINQVINTARKHGFSKISYERYNRLVTYDIINMRFISIVEID